MPVNSARPWKELVGLTQPQAWPGLTFTGAIAPTSPTKPVFPSIWSETFPDLTILTTRGNGGSRGVDT